MTVYGSACMMAAVTGWPREVLYPQLNVAMFVM